MKNANFRLIAAGIVLICAAVLLVHAQTTGGFPDLDKNGKPLIPRPSPFLWYSPIDLAHNAVTLPASGATANTNIIRTSGATAITYYMNCTQSAKLTINVYVADDVPNPQAQNFTLYGSYDLVTAVPAAAHQIYVATELAPNTTAGTLAATVRLPQAAISFSETNAGATAGTCTDRLAVKYN
jgi:hypothetical protein